MRAGGRDVLVLSSAGTIREALARHWGDWLGRPPSYLAPLVSRGGRDLALGAPTPGWRLQRGATRGALARAGPRLGAELRKRGRGLREVSDGPIEPHRDPIESSVPTGGAPLDPFEVFAFHTCSTIGGLIFGDLLPPEAEVRSFTRCVLQLLELWGRASLRALDLVPALRVLPQPGLQKLLHLVELRDAFVGAQIRKHEVGGPQCPWGVPMSARPPPRDTVLGALRDPASPGPPPAPPRLHMALVDLFIGGTETTAAALAWAIAFLLHRPELQERLRAELRRELPPGALPQASDARRLPLLRATVTETLRLRPPAPLALPHCARRSTSVGGLPVPPGSILVPNLLAAHQDPDVWQHPEEFLPERFLAPGAPLRALLPFGCGARSCLGEALARAELFVFLGQILREFRLEPPAPGLLPSLQVRAGTVLRCPPFRVRMVPCQDPA
ncbi:LOW QUALITY PROTEIN: steroid 21-hydroxylase-like [Ara ararauna]